MSKAGSFMGNSVKFSEKNWPGTVREICVILREIAWSHDSGRDFA